MFLPVQMLGLWVQISLKAWMSVSIHSAFLLTCVDRGHAKSSSPVQGVLLTLYKICISELINYKWVYARELICQGSSSIRRRKRSWWWSSSICVRKSFSKYIQICLINGFCGITYYTIMLRILIGSNIFLSSFFLSFFLRHDIFIQKCCYMHIIFRKETQTTATINYLDPKLSYHLSSAKQYSTCYQCHVPMLKYYVSTYSLISMTWTYNVSLNEVNWRTLLRKLLLLKQLLVLCWKKGRENYTGKYSNLKNYNRM